MLGLLCFEKGCDVEPPASTLAAFRAAGLPIVHVVDLGADLAVALFRNDKSRLDATLLLGGGVQTLGPGEVAVGRRGRGAFLGTSLDALLRSMGVNALAFHGDDRSGSVITSVSEATVRGYRVVAADEAEHAASLRNAATVA
jgi:hypothetical protein